MAASIALTSLPGLKATSNDQRTTKVYGTAAITAGGGTSPATGIPLNWGAIADGNFGSGTFLIPGVGPNQIANGPKFAEFYSTAGAGTSPTPQTYRYDSTNNSLVVYQAGAPVETGIVADTLNFKAEFVKGGF